MFMSAQAISAEANDNPGPHAPGPHDADTQGNRHVLQDLIAMGADLARFLHAQAAALAAQQAAAPPIQPAAGTPPGTGAQPAPASGTPNPDALINLTLAFDRIARAVRRSILLARSLSHPVQPAPDPARHRAAARRRVIREVEDAIQRTATRASASDGQDGPETLQAELRDRLDAPDLDDDISSRPTADIIAEICRDLGLAVPPGGSRPWPRRTPEDIAQLCAQAAAPSVARRPTASQPAPEPQTLRCDAAQPTPDPQRNNLVARSGAQPGPIHASSDAPEDPAETVAMILRHPARVPGPWRPPPHI